MKGKISVIKLHEWLLEAAETERRLPPAIRKQVYTNWPDIKAEWLAYAPTAIQINLPTATPVQISRYDKVLGWIVSMPRVADRNLLWAAAHSAAFRDRGPKWSKLARLLKVNRKTVKDRYEEALIRLYYLKDRN
jgi:hypothetical protein